ncbi:MAG: hypothetical protein ACK2UW_13055, partial [Anaerolineales bacterium]
MKKIVVVLLICLAFMALLGGQAGASTDIDTTVNTGPVQIDPTVQASVARSQPGDMLPVILTLRQQADLSKVHGANPAARQKAVI